MTDVPVTWTRERAQRRVRALWPVVTSQSHDILDVIYIITSDYITSDKNNGNFIYAVCVPT